MGGDRLTIDVDLGRGAHGCVTTPSATKVYRTTGEAAEQHVRLRLGPAATLEWLPDHTIPFADAALRQRIDVRLGVGARLILVEGRDDKNREPKMAALIRRAGDELVLLQLE